VSELGNLTQSIFLSLRRMSIVKIRAGSLFYNTRFRIGAEGAGFGFGRQFFLMTPQLQPRLHRLYTGAETLALAGRTCAGAKSVSGGF
jgi:hypothetical protein